MKNVEQKTDNVFCLRLTSETHEELRREAFNSRLSMNQLINKALDDYMQKNKALA